MGPLVTALVLSQLAPVKALPCRPTVACTAELVAQGHLETELGAYVVPGTTSLNALVKVSLLDWLQLQAGSDGLLVASGDGAAVVDGAIAALKVRLLAQGALAPALSLSARVAMPTRPPLPAVQTSVDLNATAHASKDLGPLHVDLNLMLNAWSLALPTPQLQGQAALALSTGLPGGLGVALEGHSTFGHPTRPNDGGLRGVLTWSATDALVFDLGADVGFFPATRAWSFFAGLVFVPTAP